MKLEYIPVKSSGFTEATDNWLNLINFSVQAFLFYLFH